MSLGLPHVMTSSERFPGRPPALESSQLDEAVKFKAQGVSDQQIATLYGVSPQTIARHLKSPQAQEKLAMWREVIRTALLRGIAEGGVTQGLAVLKKAADDNDSKGFDAAARGLMNMEKTAASASGETKKLEVSGAGGQPLQVDVRALIASFVDHNKT